MPLPAVAAALAATPLDEIAIAALISLMAKNKLEGGRNLSVQFPGGKTLEGPTQTPQDVIEGMTKTVLLSNPALTLSKLVQPWDRVEQMKESLPVNTEKPRQEQLPLSDNIDTSILQVTKPGKMFHGSDRPLEEKRPEGIPATMDQLLGVHGAEESDIADNFTRERQFASFGGAETKVGARIHILNKPKNPKIVDQSKLDSDQRAMAADILNEMTEEEFVAWAKNTFRGSSTKEGLTDRGARRAYKDLRAGKALTIDEYGYDMGWPGVNSIGEYVAYNDSALMNTGGIGGREFKQKIADRYIDKLRAEGYDGLQYQNTAPTEIRREDGSKIENTTSYIKFPHRPVSKRAVNHMNDIVSNEEGARLFDTLEGKVGFSSLPSGLGAEEKLDEYYKTHPQIDYGDADALKTLFFGDEIAIVSATEGHEGFRRRIGKGKTANEKAWKRAYELAQKSILMPEKETK